MTGSSVGFNVTDLPLTTQTDFERPLIELVFTGFGWTNISISAIRPVVVVIVINVLPYILECAVTLNVPFFLFKLDILTRFSKELTLFIGSPDTRKAVDDCPHFRVI